MLEHKSLGILLLTVIARKTRSIRESERQGYYFGYHSNSGEKPSSTKKIVMHVNANNDEEDELFETYNELLREYVKLEKVKKR